MIDHYVESMIKDLKNAGFTGDKIVLAGHSLGGVMAQKYAKKNADKIKQWNIRLARQVEKASQVKVMTLTSFFKVSESKS